MKITICGSVTFMKEIERDAKVLKKLGFTEVFIPQGFATSEKDDKELKERLTEEESAQRKIDHDLIRRHFNLIMQSDCIFVANYDKKGIKGYIGGNTFLEIGYAFVTGKPIFVLQQLPDVPYISELAGMQPIILDGKISRITQYYVLKT